MDIDVNVLIQVYNEKIGQLMTEIVVKDTRIKQMSAQIEALKESLVPAGQEKEKKSPSKQASQS